MDCDGGCADAASEPRTSGAASALEQLNLEMDWDGGRADAASEPGSTAAGVLVLPGNVDDFLKIRGTFRKF